MGFMLRLMHYAMCVQKPLSATPSHSFSRNRHRHNGAIFRVRRARLTTRQSFYLDFTYSLAQAVSSIVRRLPIHEEPVS